MSLKNIQDDDILNDLSVSDKELIKLMIRNINDLKSLKLSAEWFLTHHPSYECDNECDKCYEAGGDREWEKEYQLKELVLRIFSQK